MNQAVQRIFDNPVRNLLLLAVAGSSLALLATPYYPLSILPAMVVIGLALMGRYPLVGYYIIIAAIPYGAYRGFEGKLAFLRIHWIAAFCLLLLLAFQTMAAKRLPPGLESRIWFKWLLYLAISASAAAMSPYTGPALKSVLLLGVAGLYMALTMIFMDRRQLLGPLAQVIIWSVGLGSLLAALGYFASLGLFAEKVESGFKRGLGGAPDPNNLALMIIFSLPLLAHWYFSTTKRWSKLWALALLGFNVLGMVSTYSRGGALIMFVVLASIAIKHRKRFSPRLLGIVLGGGMLAAAIALAVVPQTYWERQQSLFEAQDLSIERRASYLIVAWDAFLERPIRGWGPDAFRFIYEKSPQAQVFVRPGRDKDRPAHNTYLEVLIGMGIFGLAVFLAILWQALSDFIRARRTFAAKGDRAGADIVAAYRLSYVSLLIFLLLFSDIYHKYLLLILAVSQVAAREAGLAPGPEGEAA